MHTLAFIIGAVGILLLILIMSALASNSLPPSRGTCFWLHGRVGDAGVNRVCPYAQQVAHRLV